nr:toll/interleukin-1 receptor domain-containing protein [uncultured Allomuricauda sp.]
MEERTVEILSNLLGGSSISLTKSNTSEVLELFPKLRNLGILTFSGKSSYHLNFSNRALLKKLIELDSFEGFLNWLDSKNDEPKDRALNPTTRMDVLKQISTYLQKTFTTKEINTLLTGYGFRAEAEAVVSKRVYALEIIETAPDQILLKMVEDMGLEFELELESSFNISKMERSNHQKERRVFISHSNKDLEIVEQLIEVLEAIGVESSSIFCSSFEGYNVGLGEDFLQSIKNELSSDVIVLFVLSGNFFSSPICLCEMGATWVSTKEHVPILIPPFDYSDMKGVIPPTHKGMKVNELEKYNSLKERIETFMTLKPINQSVWERKRNKILNSINSLLDRSEDNQVLEQNSSHKRNTGEDVTINKVPKIKKVTAQDKEESKFQGKVFVPLKKDNSPYFLNEKEIDELIKEYAANSYPDDYSMQVWRIKEERNAVQELKKPRPSDIPVVNYDKIRVSAASYGPDFGMQVFKIKELIDDFRELQTL